MAQKVAVAYTDDIDGTRAAETVSFALDGASYEIDLSARNARVLRKALATYQDAGRRVGPAAPSARAATPRRARDTAASSKRAASKPAVDKASADKPVADKPAASKTSRAKASSARRAKATSSAPAAPSADSTSNADIRAWATANGLEVSARGRISDLVRQQYAEAHA